ncbi:MAG: amidohydrolase family protein, partial [Candidatus Moranbacteria bacterium]|nr:amidohydrolase family protein [Candidatus Moranbacteria bacterium]
LYILLPDWVTEGGRSMMLTRLKDPEARKKIVKEMRASEHDYSKITISISSLDKTLNHKRIAEIAQIQNKSIEDAIIDVLIASDGRVVTMMEVLSEKNVDKAVINPFSIISSNGSGYNIEHRKTGEMVHPRNFGSFPRVLSTYVKERGVVGWEEAIRKMSGLPAEKFKISQRGTIKKGNFADVVVIDPTKIHDKASVENPYQYSEGVECVIINGHIAMNKGEMANDGFGEVILRKTSFFEF